VRALASFSYRAFVLADELIREGARFDLYKNGMLAVATREESVRAFLRGLAAARELGYDVPAEPLPADALHELEPSLSPELRHSVAIADHWHVDSGKLAVAIGSRLAQQGVRIEERAAVEGVVVERGRVRGVRTRSGTVDAEAVVLAAGAWTPVLARPLGIRLPVIGGKGYSFFVRPKAAPQRALLLLEPHVGCSPFGDVVRVAGTMEFSGLTSPIDRRRVDTIVRRVRPLLGWEEGQEGEPWAGLRPIAPDGLPVVGALEPYDGLYVATGYSMLGITLGLPLGEALAELVQGQERDDGMAPFSPQRFDRFRWTSVRARRRRAAAYG
jgi:D-amino-acid dehydrogenase